MRPLLDLKSRGVLEFKIIFKYKSSTGALMLLVATLDRDCQLVTVILGTYESGFCMAGP